MDYQGGVQFNGSYNQAAQIGNTQGGLLGAQIAPSQPLGGLAGTLLNHSATLAQVAEGIRDSLFGARPEDMDNNGKSATPNLRADLEQAVRNLERIERALATIQGNI